MRFWLSLKNLPWFFPPIPTAQTQCVIRLSTFPPVSLVLHKPLARIHVASFPCSIPSRYSEYLLIHVVNEMEKILTQSSSTYVPVEKFLNSKPRLPPIFSHSQSFGHSDFWSFLNRHCLIPWCCNASSLSASPPVSTYMHYLLILLKSQRMNESIILINRKADTQTERLGGNTEKLT